LLRDLLGAEPVVREAVEAVVAGEIEGVLAGDRPVGIRARALRELVPRQVGPYHAGVADAAEVAVVGGTDDRVVVQAAEAREHGDWTLREPGKRSMRAP
jgi:hypothetical protein